jgi:hypothetical protein
MERTAQYWAGILAHTHNPADSGSTTRVGWNGATTHLVQVGRRGYQFKFQMVQRISSLGRKFSNKICICIELNKEQLFLLELSKIWARIWIKIQGSSRVWNSIEFGWICIEFSRINTIWIISSWLYLEARSTHQREFGISNMWVPWFTSRIWFKFNWIWLWYN